MVGPSSPLTLAWAGVQQQLDAGVWRKWLGRLLQTHANVSQLLPLPGTLIDTRHSKEKHELEGSTFFETVLAMMLHYRATGCDLTNIHNSFWVGSAGSAVSLIHWQKVFNYQLSKGQSTIDNAFSVLAQWWRVCLKRFFYSRICTIDDEIFEQYSGMLVTKILWHNIVRYEIDIQAYKWQKVHKKMMKNKRSM